MTDKSSDQLRFGENGELKEREEESQSTANLKDDGDPMGRFQTKGGFSIFPVSSLLQKSVRRSDEELAAWAAWELVRSGYESMFWKRVLTIATEDISVRDDVTTQIRSLYKLGTGQENATSGWSGDEERGRICAIRAALTCAQAESSRLSDISTTPLSGSLTSVSTPLRKVVTQSTTSPPASSILMVNTM
ncbi:hypothetical protein [Halobacterium noricense]|uniref:hypothetical protein n=1 Tax=Halobacterium noricense TaxID=223182 RepID=UPI001E3D4D93|nr:hypothetical protein [Halobacterium noricense]UHH24192.1 hypothetical protein LT974_09325 [Halobacterium noricense]